MPVYSRDSFDQLRASVRRRERNDSALLAFVSVVLGIGQLGLLRWLESRFPHRTAVAIEGVVFLLYLGLVLFLLWRLQHHKRVGAPRCPQCDRPLQGDAERIAAATGRCDACGGQVVA